MVLPLVKLGTLALRTLSKPIAVRLKKEAGLHPRFRSFIISIAQVILPMKNPFDNICSTNSLYSEGVIRSTYNLPPPHTSIVVFHGYIVVTNSLWFKLFFFGWVGDWIEFKGFCCCWVGDWIEPRVYQK